MAHSVPPHLLDLQPPHVRRNVILQKRDCVGRAPVGAADLQVRRALLKTVQNLRRKPVQTVSDGTLQAQQAHTVTVHRVGSKDEFCLATLP